LGHISISIPPSGPGLDRNIKLEKENSQDFTVCSAGSCFVSAASFVNVDHQNLDFGTVCGLIGLGINGEHEAWDRIGA
jgi:hypothetical protein